MKIFFQTIKVGILTISLLFLLGCTDIQPQKLKEESASATSIERTFRINNLELPISSLDLVSTEARHALQSSHNYWKELHKACGSIPLSSDNLDLDELRATRQCRANIFLKEDKWYLATQKRYSVAMKPTHINGVYTEVFMPKEGVSAENKHRVLINVHGGGFLFGSRINSQLESIPIAAVGKIKVVSIDYRLAPEHQFPAASQDVEAVYRALLKEYKPENIGLYGCSAGGLLAAQSMAWLLHTGLPLPGAVGMFCAGAHFYGKGTTPAIQVTADMVARMAANAYFTSLTPIDHPLAFPWTDETVLEKFPPSLLISSTNDFALSSVVSTHSKLHRLGVDADLHIWEGLNHAFLYDSDLPESREAYKVIVDFFAENLGR